MAIRFAVVGNIVGGFSLHDYACMYISGLKKRRKYENSILVSYNSLLLIADEATTAIPLHFKVVE